MVLTRVTRNDQRPVRSLRTRELDRSTWPDFFRLFSKHGGVWGGCWCTFYLLPEQWHGRTPEQRREDQHSLVKQGLSHGVLVYQGAAPVGWCQFGRAEETPRVDRMRGYRPPTTALPRWRITCFFVDRDHRHQGVAREALNASLRAIADHGGGIVEAYPLSTSGKTKSSSLIWNGPLPMFERVGFRRVHRLGRHRWLVCRTVPGR